VTRPTDDGCRDLYNQLRGAALGFQQQLSIVDDAARKADVLPGTIREIWERHHLEH
jgi:hypothetical protein